MELNWEPLVFRWLHLVAACALVGSVFFFHVILPLGARGLEPALLETASLRWRRGFKMTVHVSLLLFLVSGIYNIVHNAPKYALDRRTMHGLAGAHVLLGLGGITMLMVTLAGRKPRQSSAVWTRWALVIFVLAIAVASTLKSVRESTPPAPALKKM